MQTSDALRREIAKLYRNDAGRGNDLDAFTPKGAREPAAARGEARPYPTQPFNFAIEAMSTFKFLDIPPRSIVGANQVRNRGGE